MPEYSLHDPIWCERQDTLERRYLAKRIFARLVNDACPGVIGIYGGWGTGKTSLLNLIQERWRNSGEQTIHIEYIDAWNYEGSATLFVPVIVRMMSRRLDKIPDWSEYFQRVSTMALYLGSDLMLRTVLATDLDTLKKYKTDMQETGLTHVSLLDWEELTDKVAETQSAFELLVKKSNQKAYSKRVVFLIDNLDRCSPENAVSLLESIKNFLSIHGCTWVFAMDSEVVASYISHKYEGTKMDGNSYLDKIIPEQYHLSFYPEENDRRVFGLISDVVDGDLSLRDEKRLPQLPRVMVPRRLKKSAGKFAEYFDGSNPDADPDTIFLMSLLYHAWPEFYERLSSPSLRHVGEILANFFKTHQAEDPEWKWGDYVPSPLDPKFTEDPDLKYFLQIAFPNYRNCSDAAREVHRAVNGLRQIGLP
jgi:hypothetical protein